MLCFLVITPDGRIVMRSLIYGGKAAEVQHMLNDSKVVAQLQGEYLSVWKKKFFLSQNKNAAMGYVPKEGFETKFNIIMWDGAGSRAHLGGNVGLETPADRYQDGVRLDVSFCNISLLFLNVSWKESSGDDSTALQKFRSLVERMIRRVKAWKDLKFRQLSPHNRESVQKHLERLEADVDDVIGLEMLDFLAKEARLETIPKKPARGFENRIITNTDLKPAIDLPRALSLDMSKWPAHLREFKADLTVLSPELKAHFSTILKKTDKLELSTANVHLRGGNLAQSGNVALISVAKDVSSVETWLVEVEVWASMRQLVYLGGIKVTKGAAGFFFCCSCTNG